MLRSQQPISSSLFREDLEHVLARTCGFWEEVSGQRLFVTGGTGFFGMWLIESFLWANEQIGLDAQMVVLSRDPAAFYRRMPHLESVRALTLVAGDTRNFAFPEGRFSHVIHAANYPGGEGVNRATMLDMMIRGIRHTLDFARHCGATKFLFASSGSVYGPQPAEMKRIAEAYQAASDANDPRFTHAYGKRSGERLCVLYDRRYGIEAKIARGFAFVGPYLALDANYAIGNFMRDALAGNPIVVRGDGTPYRSYLYAADLAVWLWTILFRGERCRPYNVGSEEAVAIADVAHAVAAAVNPPLPVHILEAAKAGAPPQRYVPDCCRAAEELGLRQEIGLAKAIRRTLRWHDATCRLAAEAEIAGALRDAAARRERSEKISNYRTMPCGCAALGESVSSTQNSFCEGSLSWQK